VEPSQQGLSTHACKGRVAKAKAQAQGQRARSGQGSLVSAGHKKGKVTCVLLSCRSVIIVLHSSTHTPLSALQASQEGTAEDAKDTEAMQKLCCLDLYGQEDLLPEL